MLVRSSARHFWTRTWSVARTFATDTRGATAIEYCLIASGISIAIVATVGTLGSTLVTKFSSVSTALK